MNLLKKKDIYKEDYFFEGLPNINKDEYDIFFISEEEISDFFSSNSFFVKTFKNYVFIWALKLSKLIKDKFSRKDPTLLPRKPLTKPKDKIYNPDEENEKEDEKEDEKEEGKENKKEKKEDKKEGTKKNKKENKNEEEEEEDKE